MVYTTLNRIRSEQPCSDGWAKLLAHLGKTKADDEPVSFATILASNGIEDALWCLRAADEPALCRRLAVAFARQVQHLMQDPRSLATLDVAERHASGLASDDELAEARRDACVAAYAAYASHAATYAAYAAAYAAYAATYAAYAAAYAAHAAHAAHAATYADADAAQAKAEMRTKQSAIFLKEIEK